METETNATTATATATATATDTNPAVAAVAAPPAPAATTTGAAAEQPGAYTVPASEFHATQARLAKLAELEREAEQKAREAEDRALKAAIKEQETGKALELLNKKTDAEIARAKQEAEAKLAAEKQRYEADIRRREEEAAAAKSALNETIGRAATYARDGELSRALAGHNLVEGAADELTGLLAQHLQVTPEGKSFAVKSTTGQTVKEFVDAYLASRPHWLRADSRVGTALSGSTSAATATAANPVAPASVVPGISQPKNMGEAAILDMISRRKESHGTPTVDMSQPFGLRAAR